MDASLIPLAMMRIAEPRTYDLVIVSFKRRLNYQFHTCDFSVICFQCDSCSQCDFCEKGAEASKDLEKNIKRLNVIWSWPES